MLIAVLSLRFWCNPVSAWSRWGKSLCKIKECQKAKWFTLQVLFTLFLSCNAYKTKVVGRLKVHPVRQTAPLFVATGCSEPSKKSHFQDYFQCQWERKGPAGQVLLSKWWLLFVSVCIAIIFLSQKKAYYGDIWCLPTVVLLPNVRSPFPECRKSIGC